MLKRIRIQNFKCLKDTGDLEIKPLTFLVGPNSSGKSSFFQFLLALRQTAQCPDIGYPLILQDYVDLGSYKDVIFSHNQNNKLQIEFNFEKKEKNSIINYYFSYDISVQKTGKKAGKIYLNSIKYEGPFFFFEIVKEEPVDKENPENIISQIREMRFKNVLIKISKRPKTDSYLVNFLSPKELKEKEIIVKVGHFHRIFVVKEQHFLPIPFFELTNIIDQLFSKLFHIGPLREEPHRVYTGAGIVPKDVGKTGKWSIDALLIESDLLFNVKDWLRKFNISSDINIRELKKGSKRYEVMLKDIHTEIEVNLTDVGFGTSQILPIIIESLITPQGSTILLEQPEIHLHPKGQVIMGELLVNAIKKGNKKFIVETHSDLILSKICTFVAKKELSIDDVVIYYFDPHTDGTAIIRIGINEDGQYENFPDGFFEERYKEAMERADI